MDEMFSMAVKALVICGALVGASAVGNACGRLLAALWPWIRDFARRRAVSSKIRNSPPQVIDVQERSWSGLPSRAAASVFVPMRDPETTQPGMPALPAPTPGTEPETWLGCTCSGAPHASTCPLSSDRTAVTRRERSGAPPPMMVDVVSHEPPGQIGCRCAEWPFQCRTSGCTCEAGHARS